MTNSGLTETPKETTSVPTMYQEVMQDEDVARGCVKITEIIAYDIVGKKKDDEGIDRIIEKGRQPCFCQNREDVSIYAQNNPGVRTETFTIQVLKSTAIKYLNDPENMKQFGRKI